MEILIKASAAALCCAVLVLLIRKTNPEIGLLMTTLTSVIILMLALKIFASVKEVLEIAEITSKLNGAYSAPIQKCVGIGIVTKLVSDVCRDAGQAAPASAIDICGAMCAVYVSLPLFKIFLRMIGDLA